MILKIQHFRRRQHRLECEQADIEYEIRVLMAQPECNKTDSDKAREEALISRLVEVNHFIYLLPSIFSIF